MRRSRRERIAMLEAVLRAAERRAPVVRARYAELRAVGVRPRVASRIEGGVPHVAVELPVDVWRKVLDRIRATSP